MSEHVRADVTSRRWLPAGLGLMTLGLALSCLLWAASPVRAAEVYGEIGSFDGSAQFGVNGPGASAVHEATQTLYIVDSSNHRILKLDISDPSAPELAQFSALAANAITQADGVNLDLGPYANIAVDNSGGPQDGTIYLATNTAVNADSRASAFAPSGQWLYDFRHDNLDDNGVVASGGELMPAAAIAVGPDGEIFRLGTPANLNSTGALYDPGAEAGELPVFRMAGSPAVTGVNNAFFWPDSSEVLGISRGFGTTASLQASPLSTLVVDSQYRYSLPTGAFGTAYAPTAEKGKVVVRLNASVYPPPAKPARLAVVKFTSTGYLNPGTVLEEFALGTAGSGAALGYESSRDLVISPDTASSSISVYGRVIVPDIEMLDPGYEDATTATLRARVDLLGRTVTDCRFEWGTTEAYGSTSPCTPPTGSGEIEVSASASPVSVGSAYHSRLVLTVDGREIRSADLEWQHPGLAEATTLGAGTITRSGTALLGGLVNPNGTLNTRFYIEYSRDPGLANPSFSPPGKDGDAGAGTADQRVSTVLSGLQPDTQYYFRLVAETGAGRDEGAILAFKTFNEPSAAQPSSCPNDQLREGESARLPDCRAWEKISPDEKQGGITGIGKTFARADGGRVMYGGKYTLDDTKSHGTTVAFIADREDGNWSNQSVQEAASMPDNGTTSDWTYASFTSDLKWLVGGGLNVDLPDIGHAYNDPVYIRDVDGRTTNTIAVGDRKNVLAEGKLNQGEAGMKIAANKRVVIFKGKNLPVDSGNRHPGIAFYWWTPEDGVSIASEGPDGDPVSIPNTPQSTIYAISPEGDKALWDAGALGTKGLFVSRRGQPTLEVTKADGVPQPAAPNVFMQGWTPDLRYVYFSSAQQFTVDALAGTNLYRYDTVEQDLENMLPNVPGGVGLQGLANLTPDGTHVYFYATAALAAGAEATGSKLYHWADGDITLVTNAAQYSPLSGYSFAEGRSYGRLTRASKDGRYFLFAHEGSLAGTAMDSVIDPGGNRVLFRYDAVEERVDCVSCSAAVPEVTSDGYLTQPYSGFMESLNFDIPMAGERYHMSDAGEVMFTTAQALTEGDVNGTYDTYLWDGDLRRITSGKSALPEWAETATEDFHDIYVHSYRRLVPSDADDSADLYVARVGGGISSQQVRPEASKWSCEGPSCQDASVDRPAIGKIESAIEKSEALASSRSLCQIRRKHFRQARARVIRNRVAVRRASRRGSKVQVRRRRVHMKRAVVKRRRAVRAVRRACQGGGH